VSAFLFCLFFLFALAGLLFFDGSFFANVFWAHALMWVTDAFWRDSQFLFLLSVFFSLSFLTSLCSKVFPRASSVFFFFLYRCKPSQTRGGRRLYLFEVFDLMSSGEIDWSSFFIFLTLFLFLFRPDIVRVRELFLVTYLFFVNSVFFPLLRRSLPLGCFGPILSLDYPFPFFGD